MNTILYRPIVYESNSDCLQIEQLYQKIFQVDFSVKGDIWFQPERNPLGILAVDQITKKVVGHFSSIKFDAIINGHSIPFRMSMGFMTDPEYRGKGIATHLYQYLRKEILQEQEARFIIGFPNDTSYNMHLTRMDYYLYRNYHFVVFPRGCYQHIYTKYAGNFFDKPSNSFEFNCLDHSATYMNWRYQNSNYDKWQSESGHIFVSVKYQNKVDILYWDKSVSCFELLDFAAFLYKNCSVEKVSTWNSAGFLDIYPRESREYHMCINYLNCSPAEMQAIQQDWLFLMGDCELF